MIEIQWNPDRRTLRLFGVCTGAVLALLGLWIFLRHSLLGFALPPITSRRVAIGLWIAAGHMVPMGLLAPQMLWPVYILMNLVGYPIGLAVSHVILFVVFYGLFTPLALVFRLTGRDALERRIDPQAETYWTDHDPEPPPERYFRQF